MCHNAKFEHKILRRVGVDLQGFEDTKIAAYVLGETPTGLKPLAKQWLQVLPETYSDVTQGRDMSELTAEEITSYAAADADNTLRLWRDLEPLLHEHGVYSLYKNIELPLVPVLSKMEGRGVLVDEKLCEQVGWELGVAKSSARNRCIEALEVGAGFNIDSPDQLEALFVGMGAPLTKRTPSDERFSVDADSLESIKEWNPALIRHLLDYRKYTKMQTYVDGFIDLRGPDGRLHTSMNQAGHFEEAGGTGEAPSTGRMSSSGPNLGNVPHHRATIQGVDWGKIIRRCLIAPEGYVLISADLAQEEPRIIAEIAHDQTILDAVREGRDIYRPTTEAMYPYTADGSGDDVWKETWGAWERYNGKQLFLAWYYGAGAKRVKMLDPTLSYETVRTALSNLSKAHPARDPYLDETRAMLEEDGYAESLFGRRRWFPAAWSKRMSSREEALRQAANMRIQSTAADILKMALPRIDAGLEGTRSGLLFTVYDEVVLEVHEDEVDEAVEVIKDVFKTYLPSVGLPIEVMIGRRWGDRLPYSGRR